MLSKDAGLELYLYLKCHSSTGVFQTFGSKNQLPGFYISRTLVENELKAKILVKESITILKVLRFLGINFKLGSSS